MKKIKSFTISDMISFAKYVHGSAFIVLKRFGDNGEIIQQPFWIDAILLDRWIQKYYPESCVKIEINEIQTL